MKDLTIYYSTTDYNVITNYSLAEAYFLSTGKKVDPFNEEALDKIIPEMKGVVSKVDAPNWKFLAEHGHKFMAVRIYKETHDCSVAMAKETVEYFIDSVNLKKKLRRKKNDKTNNEGNETIDINDVQQSGMEGQMSDNASETSCSDISEAAEANSSEE